MVMSTGSEPETRRSFQPTLHIQRGCWAPAARSSSITQYNVSSRPTTTRKTFRKAPRRRTRNDDWPRGIRGRSPIVNRASPSTLRRRSPWLALRVCRALMTQLSQLAVTGVVVTWWHPPVTALRRLWHFAATFFVMETRRTVWHRSSGRQIRAHRGHPATDRAPISACAKRPAGPPWATSAPGRHPPRDQGISTRRPLLRQCRPGLVQAGSVARTQFARWIGRTCNRRT